MHSKTVSLFLLLCHIWQFWHHFSNVHFSQMHCRGFFQPSPLWLPSRPQPVRPRSDQPRLAAGGNTASASAKRLSEPWSCRAAGERLGLRDGGSVDKKSEKNIFIWWFSLSLPGIGKANQKLFFPDTLHHRNKEKQETWDSWMWDDGCRGDGHCRCFQWTALEKVTVPAPELPQSVQLHGYYKSAILWTPWNGGYLSH